MSDLLQDAADDLQYLVDAMCDRPLTLDETLRLENYVSTSADARWQFIERAALCAELEWTIGLAPPVAASTATEVCPSPPQAVTAAAARSSLWSRASLILGRPVTWSVLAAGLLFAGYFVAVSWNIRNGHLPTGNEPTSVARIESTQDAAWSTNVAPDLKAMVQVGERLQIDSGLVELRLSRGVTLLVEGPATWSVDGDNVASLERGRLVAKVPSAATGFLLKTPHSQIVDLGTEFGVEVGDAHSATVTVLQGTVQVMPLASVQHPGAKSTRVTLRAGEVRQFVCAADSTEWRSQTLSTGPAFVRQLASPATHFRMLPQKEIEIRDSGPLPFRSGVDPQFKPSGDDLLQTALDPRKPHWPPAGTPGKFEDQLVESLIDGRLYSPSIGNPQATTLDSFSSADGQAIEFYFDCTNAPHGYDVERIESITAWVGERLGQKYLVFWRQKGKSRFETAPAISVDLPALTAGCAERKVVVQGKQRQTLASGVDAVSFMLLERPDGLKSDVYREIDVIGRATSQQ